MNDDYKENIQLVKQNFPEIYQSIQSIQEDGGYSLIPTLSGLYTVCVSTPDGHEVYIHSQRDPLIEAGRIGESLTGKHRMVIFLGCGLFYHIMDVLEKMEDQEPVILVEKDPRLFLTALQCMPLASLLERENTVLFLDADPVEVERSIKDRYGREDLAGLKLIRHLPCFEIDPDYYGETATRIQRQSDIADALIHDPGLVSLLEKRSSLPEEITLDELWDALKNERAKVSETNGIVMLMNALRKE